MSIQALTASAAAPQGTTKAITIPVPRALSKTQHYLHALREDGWGVPDLGFVAAGAIVFLYALAIAIKLSVSGTTKDNFRDFVYPLGFSLGLGLIGLVISCIRLVRSDDDAAPTSPGA